MAAPTQLGIAGSRPPAGQPGRTRFFAFLTVAGLLNSLIAAFLFLHLPADHRPTLTSLAARASIFVVIGAMAGTAGAGLYWRSTSSPFSANPPIPFRLFALSCAAAWVWVPAFVLLSREDSPLTGPIAILAAAVLAVALRKAIPAIHSSPRIQAGDRSLFADTLLTPRHEAHGYIAALCIYLALYDLLNGWIIDGSFKLALAAFICAWKLTLEPVDPSDSRRQTGRAVRRLAWAVFPAILVTLFSLLYGVEHRNRVEAEALVRASANGDSPGDAAGNKPASDTPASANGISGYQSIILWPISEKELIVPPIPQQTSLLAPGTTKPLVIRFTGPYYYFQPPHKTPSPTALQVHGTPLIHDFQSNNFMPLTMEAHQNLGGPIPLVRCREIQLDILNSDNRPGPINIAMLLADSAAPSNQLYLGQQPVLTSQAGNFAFKSTAVGETLRFSIPASAKIRRFDQITIMFFPDEANYDQGSKVAIQQFQLVPR